MQLASRLLERRLAIAAFLLLGVVRWLTLAHDPWEWDEVLFVRRREQHRSRELPDLEPSPVARDERVVTAGAPPLGLTAAAVFRYDSRLLRRISGFGIFETRLYEAVSGTGIPVVKCHGGASWMPESGTMRVDAGGTCLVLAPEFPMRLSFPSARGAFRAPTSPPRCRAWATSRRQDSSSGSPSPRWKPGRTVSP